MNDPLEILKRIKDRYPDLRIGQIIANALPSNFNSDPYHITDEALAKELIELETILSVSIVTKTNEKSTTSKS